MNHHLHNQLAAARVDELARRAAQQRPIAPSHRHVGRLPAWSAFILVAAIVGLALFASAAPSPLYADYAARWHFSTPMLTVVFATYAVGALSALLLVGRLSDDLGRRPLLAAGLVGLLVAALLFALARSVEWLLAARLVQGVATGTILSAAGAALLELEPGRDIGRAGLVNGVSASLGIGAGALVASLLVQDAPDPLVTPFVLLCVLVGALGGVALLPEPVARTMRPGLRPQRPEVPAEVRGVFALASAGVVASWSIAGLYLALAPSLAVILLHTESHVAGGVSVFALGISAGLGQVALRGLAARQATAAGALGLALGMAGTVASIPADSGPLFLAGSVITGAGFGVAFMGALRSVSAAAPARQRAGVIAAFYVVAYLALSVPSVLAGLAVPRARDRTDLPGLRDRRNRARTAHRRRNPPRPQGDPDRSASHEMTHAHPDPNGGSMQSKLLALLQPDDQSRAEEALSDEVVFHSPVRDYHGRADVAHLVSTIAGVVNEITAEREFAADREIVTIITASHGGRLMDGVLYETHDTAGRIERATLLLRPLSTLRQAIAEMGAALEQSPLPSRR